MTIHIISFITGYCSHLAFVKHTFWFYYTCSVTMRFLYFGVALKGVLATRLWEANDPGLARSMFKASGFSPWQPGGQMSESRNLHFSWVMRPERYIFERVQLELCFKFTQKPGLANPSWFLHACAPAHARSPAWSLLFALARARTHAHSFDCSSSRLLANLTRSLSLSLPLSLHHSFVIVQGGKFLWVRFHLRFHLDTPWEFLKCRRHSLR